MKKVLFQRSLKLNTSKTFDMDYIGENPVEFKKLALFIIIIIKYLYTSVLELYKKVNLWLNQRDFFIL
ncbi:hypothetical protein P4576_16950 [Peribacillus frigoritolerans]|uniref:hypothetical protein n=1 Tax=Peribacillus frigoritolerans TaxID=450367 RepID=UPI002E2096A8|nr:hypothetical protein [Peribacillus frigoritolerans]